MTDYDGWHCCHFCGELVKDGYDSNGNKHFLSDCRPDLVKHEIGPTCTWHIYTEEQTKLHGNKWEAKPQEQTCYGYQDHWNQKWTDKHEHFYTDGPT
jgi:hypothetical protein